MTATLAYTTTTGQQPVANLTAAQTEELFPAPVFEPFCFVCGRCTDHTGEHDDLEAAGLASYDYERGYVSDLRDVR